MSTITNTRFKIRILSIFILILSSQFTFSQLTIFSDANQSGLFGTCVQNTIYVGNTIPQSLDNQVSSIRLQQGYMATLADNEDGTGSAYTFVAATSNVTVNLSNLLNDKVSFIRVLPLRDTKKKGIGHQNNAWIDQLNVSWFYDWGPLDVTLPAREYVLMAWGRNAANNTTSINNYIAKPDITHLLSFNEPDGADQANIGFSEAVNLHKNLAATGYRIGSPATTEGQATGWLTNFMDSAARANVKVDFVAVHWYDWGSYLSTLNTSPDPNAVFTRFKNYINNIYAIYNKPIWITEFNSNRNTTSATHEAFIALALPWLEAQPFVERYAYFFPPAWPPVDANGNLTAIGNAYKNQVSTQPALGRNWDNTEHIGTGNSGVFEGENATFTLATTNNIVCTFASNGLMTPGVTGTNKIIFHNVTVKDAGNYTLGISYYALAARNITVQVNGNYPLVTPIPASGDWCFNGGSPATYQMAIQLNAGMNRVMFTVSPIIDKISIDFLSALPVKLLEFNSQLKAGGIELNWKTAQEINNKYFELLKSKDRVNFETIARVNGNNNSQVTNAYKYLDRAPFTGINYYQLKQVDFDGNATRSKIISVKYGAAFNSMRSIFSASKDLIIAINLSDAKKGNLIFTDMVGRVLFNQNMSLAKGENVIKIPAQLNNTQLGVISFVSQTERLSIKVLR